jgi:hypothetical protein
MAKHKGSKGVGRKLSSDELNKRLNIGLHTARKMGLNDDADFKPKLIAAEPIYSAVINWPSRLEVIAAPTSPKTGTDKRPRALECAYDKKTETLIIAMRPKTTRVGATTVVSAGTPPLILYPDVPVDMWDNLKQSDSTGRFLASSMNGAEWEEVTLTDLRMKFELSGEEDDFDVPQVD